MSCWSIKASKVVVYPTIVWLGGGILPSHRTFTSMNHFSIPDLNLFTTLGQHVNLPAFTTDHISAHALLLNEWLLKQAHCGHWPDHCVSHTSSVVSLWQTNRIPVWKASSIAKCQLPVLLLYVLPANPPFRKQFRHPIHSKHIYVVLKIPNN